MNAFTADVSHKTLDAGLVVPQGKRENSRIVVFIYHVKQWLNNRKEMKQ